MGTNENQTYEVQLHHNGRWQVQTRYPFHERMQAISDAKDLSRDRKNVPVRVILEDYNPKTGRHEERLIYKNGISPHKKKTARTKRANSWADMAVSSDGRIGYLDEDIDRFLLLPDNEDVEPVKVKVSAPMFLGICLSIAAMGVGAGGAATGLLYLLMHAFDIGQFGNIQRFLLIGMFGLVFMIATSSSYAHYAARFDLNIFKKKKRKPVHIPPSRISQEMKQAAQAIANTKPTADVNIPPPSDDFTIFDKDDLKEETPAPDQSDSEEEATAVFELSDEAEKQKMFLINFLGTCLGALKGPDTSLEKLNRFGLNMFMTGAVINIAQDRGLNESETQFILYRILEMLGASTQQAERFERDLSKNLAHPRHLRLFENSGKIAVRYADGDQSAPLYIRTVLQDWLNWKPAPQEHSNPNLLTIMFTDMVGSTDLASKHGDYAAQEVLKTHDLIVRTALTNFEGKEIKHLGDGIMASFKDPDLAIQAAIEIHKRVEGNNKAGPEFPFHLRVGLHIGEPIKKGDDLFGSAVQLAARICNYTDGGKLAISRELREVFGERPVYTFVDQGDQKLKGFEEPQRIFEVDWTAAPLTYEDTPAPNETSETPVQDTEEDTPLDNDTLEELENRVAPQSTYTPPQGAPDMAAAKVKPAIKADPNFSTDIPWNGSQKKATPPKSETSPNNNTNKKTPDA